MSDMDDKDRARDRSRRERPSRFSESSRDRSHDRGRDRGGMKSSNCRVYVSNIPYEYRWQDMKDLFRSQVGDVQFVELFVDENDKSRGCGIVEFSDSSSVKKCMEVMQRFEVKTRKLIIKEDIGNVRDKHGNIVGSGGGNKRNRDEGRYREDRFDPPSSRRSDPLAGGGGASDGPDKWGNTYGLSPHFLESLRIDTPLCNRVFIANLEYNVDKKKIKEVFRLAGRIVHVDLHHDKDGRSRGFAVVEYDHPVEAVQAISMFHNQVLIDRPMTVRIDRANEQLKLPDGLKGIGMGLGTNGEPLKDVARNLPCLQNTQSSNAGGAGILGAVPNSALQVASALTGLNNIGGTPFGGLASTPSVLQAANLSSLLGANGISTSDLSNFAASNLVSANALGNSSSLLNANSSSMGGGNLGGGNLGGGSNSNNYSRGGGDNSYNSNQNSSSNYGQNQGGYSNNNNSGSGRNYQNYDAVNVKRESGGFQFGNSGRDNYNSSGSMGTINPLGGGGGGQLMRSQNVGGGGQHQGNNMKGDGFSRKVLISNLPQSASYKVLTEKFSEFGDIQHLEEKGTGSMLVVYGADWQAERAIKNLDRARIDGRTIDARFFF